MSVPLLDLSQQHTALEAELTGVFKEILTSGRFILGPHVESLEKNLSQVCAARAAVGVSSGTDAILVALMALGVGPGDEVVTTPFTFFATAGCVSRVGARPVFADIDPVTFNIDPGAIEAAITPRTKAIIPVHLFGQAADMEAILAITRRRKVAVIEDACQAIGARVGDKPVGALGDVGCLSFYPSKNLAAIGDAGACVTNDAALAERIRLLRLHGAHPKYYHALIGGNFRIDALHAAMLNVKLPHLPRWTEARRAHARRYMELLGGLPIVLPSESRGRHHVFNQFTIRVPGGRRDDLRRHLTSHAIGQEVYYPVPMHLQKCFESLGYRPGAFPRAEAAANEVLSLPIFPELTTPQQDEVAKVVRQFFA